MRRGDSIERGLKSLPDDCWMVFGSHAVAHSKHWHLFCTRKRNEVERMRKKSASVSCSVAAAIAMRSLQPFRGLQRPILPVAPAGPGRQRRQGKRLELSIRKPICLSSLRLSIAFVLRQAIKASVGLAGFGSGKRRTSEVEGRQV